MGIIISKKLSSVGIFSVNDWDTMRNMWLPNYFTNDIKPLNEFHLKIILCYLYRDLINICTIYCRRNKELNDKTVIKKLKERIIQLEAQLISGEGEVQIYKH